MKTAYVFPGQGSQAKGMGEALFGLFPELVREADGILGYSIEELCVKDPGNQLQQTQFTQVALFVVNALSWLKLAAEAKSPPDYFMGHSLGEYDALYASGAVSFADGVRLVQRRGQLMAKARNGGMAAVVGLKEDDVRRVLAEHGARDLVIANLNAPTQTVIAGPAQTVLDAKDVFERANATYMPLKVSGAFHSPLMEDAAAEFRAFVASIRFERPRVPVIANVTARPYGDAPIGAMLVDQITHPVKWSEGIRYLMGKGVDTFTEVGPGRVLTGLVTRIKRDAQPLIVDDEIAPKPAPPARKRPDIVFMYAGQGSHYYNMGRELYERDATFKRSMDDLSARLEPEIGRPLTAILYDSSKRLTEFNDVLHTNAAIFCVQYSLTQVLRQRGIVPQAVLGSSVGELVAAVVAGVLDVDDGLRIVVQPATWFRKDPSQGGMLVVLEKMKSIEDQATLFRGCTLAAENYDGNFILSGARPDLTRIGQELSARGVASSILPIAHAFHSAWLDPYADRFMALARTLRFRPAAIPFYSAAKAGPIEGYAAIHLWRAIRDRIRFAELIEGMRQPGRFVFADISPTGSLAGFIKWGFGNQVPASLAMNQYGHNLKALEKMASDIATQLEA
jgi:malonyl CoA-acyl carrier protein transacylase